MATKIVFINGSLDANNVVCEQFAYDFKPLCDEVRDMRERVRTATNTSFDYTRAFFSALASSSYGLLCSIAPSFTYSVLGVDGPQGMPATIEALFFKTIVWGASLTFSFAFSVYNRFSQNLGWNSRENQETLMSLSKILDGRHFRTKALALDTSNVPANVTVNSLLAMFDPINFNNEAQPGYMAESSRKEGYTTYTPEELKANLIKFADRVTNRTPFLGTPPAHDVMALMKFYQQIEDAVRLSIHKSNQDLSAFQERRGTDTSTYTQEDLTEYKNILEDRSRLVIDLAIAGPNCGARYMGDSMTVYGNFYGAGAQTQETLEDNLIEVLAHKRKAIVETMIQSGSSVVDTHRYAEHMALLGGVLGLPGTNGVVEHLSHKLNRTERLKRFFEFYTEDTIIDSINEKWQDVEGGRVFRDQIFDWIKDLMGDWNKGKYNGFLESAEIQTLQTQLETLKTAECDVSKEMNLLNLLSHLIAELKPNLTKEVTTANWDEFLLETVLTAENDVTSPMFAAKKNFRDAITELARANLPANTPAGQIKMKTSMETQRILQSIKTAFSAQALKPELLSSLVSFANQNEELDTTAFTEVFSKPKKQTEALRLFQSLGPNLASTTAAAVVEDVSEAKRVLSQTHIEADSILRFLNGKLTAKELIGHTYEKARKEEFIGKFQVYGDQGYVNHRYENLARQERVRRTKNGDPVFDKNNQPVYEDKTTYEPLPPALIEVLLVSHKIFLPQSITNGGI